MGEWKETSFGNIPIEWEVQSFKNVLKIKGRIGWKGYKTSDLRNSGPVVIGGVNIKSTINLDYSKLTHLSIEKYEESPEIFLKKGDVILVTRGNGIGDVGRYDGKFREATINPSVVILTEFKGDSKFLYYFLVSPQGKEQILSLECGSSIPALYQGLLKNLNLPFPKKEIQESISFLLSGIDDKIDLLLRQNITLEAMAETHFRQWFVEEAKEDWEKYKLVDIAEHLKVIVIPAKNPATLFYHYSLPAFDEGQNPIAELGVEILSNKYRVFPESILVSKLNPKFPRIWAIGSDINESSICSTEFQLYKPKDSKYFAYLFCLLKSDGARNALEMAASGTSGSHQRVRPEDISNIPFTLPNLDLAIDFSLLTQPLLNKINQNKTQIRTLTALRDTLLPKLMNGEVAINL